MGERGLLCPWCGVHNLWDDIRANAGHMHCCGKAKELGDLIVKVEKV